MDEFVVVVFVEYCDFVVVEVGDLDFFLGNCEIVWVFVDWYFEEYVVGVCIECCYCVVVWIDGLDVVC